MAALIAGSTLGQVGGRTDFGRIDAGDGGGAAALTDSGALYLSAGNGTWRPTGIRGEDVGIGGGRLWAVDPSGRLFVYANGAWSVDGAAPGARDVGVGGEGTLYIVGRDVEHALGGGRVHRRDPGTGVWSAAPGRLSSISVTERGAPLGVNSLDWRIASTDLLTRPRTADPLGRRSPAFRP